MRRALVWLNLYGREAVRQKLKNSLKTRFLCFCVFRLFLARIGRNFDDYRDFQLTIGCAYDFATQCKWFLLKEWISVI